MMSRNTGEAPGTTDGTRGYRAEAIS